MIVLIPILAAIAIILWFLILCGDADCPRCGTKMDKAGNDYYCRKCRKLWHMNMFGILKERK
jgi:hypothetical protein